MSEIRNQSFSLPDHFSSGLFQFDEVVVDGPDAVQFISNFITADINGVKVNEGCDTFSVTPVVGF